MEAFSLAFFGVLYFLPLFPSRPSVSCLQHDTSARLGYASLEVCVCAIVGFMISCQTNRRSHLCRHKLAHVAACDLSVM